MNASKNKGKTFERWVAKYLTDIFKLNFNRVPNSGAFVGGQNAYRSAQLTNEQKLLVDGDIIVPKELAAFSFECKWYKEFKWSNLINDNKESNLFKWIDQTIQTMKPFWFIIFRINRQGEFLCAPKSQIDMFSSENINALIQFKYNDEVYVICNLQKFFDTIENRDMILGLGDRWYLDENTWILRNCKEANE